MPDGRQGQAAFVIKHIIHPPGIGADAGDGQIAGGGFFKAGLEFIQEPVEFPVQCARYLGGAGGKTMEFFEGDFAPIECSQNEAPAVGSKVTGKIISRHTIFRLV